MNSKLRDILNDFRRQTIVIDNNNSLGGGERGAEAFKSSIDAAEKAIRQAVGGEMLELMDASAKEAHSGSQHIEILRQKIKEWAVKL